MNSKNSDFAVRKAALGVLLAAASATAAAQATAPARTAPPAGGAPAVQESGDTADAIGHLNRAIAVLHQMQRNRDVAARLAQSKGVFIVPDSVRVAVGIGGRGGAGVLLVRRADGWGTPAFYNMAGVTLGAQLGAEGGGMAFILNDDKALNSFAQESKFGLNADAGLTLVDWSKKGEGSIGWGNITAWSDTEGLFGGATISVMDINFDAAETTAYYQRPVTPRDVVSGKVPNPRLASLRQALASPGTAAGAQGQGGASDSKTGRGEGDLQPTKR
ncbi:lipid-binding SYLF domain-containing protein [Massilia consociata]|uniref:Lipid-binding SYLF domain-containing protein n=1 Tax=Massilia consociata TaxID=760117 RepID=A0ABV6FDU5_9BURK